MGRVVEVEFKRGTADHSRPSQTKTERAPKTRPGGGSNKLTQRLVNEVSAPVSGKLRVPDGEVRGLFLRVTPSSAKSYILRYTVEGRRGEAAIGDARSITLVAARAKAVAMLSDLAVRNVDPVAKKQYFEKFPQDGAKYTFEHLHEFESEHPDLFLGMYKVYLRRKGDTTPHPLDSFIELGRV